jgi:uncharacterized protein YecE (DUF72 family)
VSQCYNQVWNGGYSSAAERLTVAQDVVGSIPTIRPKIKHHNPCNPPAPVNQKTEQSSGAPVYVGCSGWAYPTWKPKFYPPQLSSKQFLEFYATRLNTVEVNYTFRSLPTQAIVDAWLAQTGPSFRFSFKAPQRITHIKRLKDCPEPLAAFADAIRPVIRAKHIGLVLFQLPPNMKADHDRLTAFLRDAKKLKLRMAFEFRHPSWFDAATYRILEKNKAALCVAESDELETPDVTTAPFSCYRLRKSKYSKARLAALAEHLARLSERGEVFAYFKHEDEPTGALHATTVLRHLQERAS